MAAPQQLPDLRLQGLLVDEQAATLVDDLLWRGRNVLLTPTWIAQAQKADSQRMLMAVERDTLWGPYLGQHGAGLARRGGRSRGCR
jgi:hypothetical protein